ncbi:hypothetical protein WG899_11665 [Paucibacter sp. AS339]|uniref:hypothetical protein n=1 Tax=Paucibacter hankyongi TaxID=3133434 RepID=UPI0030B5DD3E
MSALIAPIAPIWSRYSPLLLAPFRERRRSGELWIWLALLLIVAAMAVAAGIGWGAHEARTVLGIATIPTLLILWGICFADLRQQNRPNAARLVPGHLARLRRCAVGLMLGLSLLVAAVFGAATSSPLLWGLCAALTMLTVAVCMRWWWFGLTIWIVPSLGFWWPFDALRLQLWAGLQRWYLEQPASLLVVALLVLPYLLTRLLQDGGSAHRRSHAKEGQWRKLLANQQQSLVTPKHASSMGLSLMRVFVWPQPLWLAYLLRHAKPVARSALARAELVSLGNLHWTCFAGSFSVIATLFALGAAWLSFSAEANWAEIGGNGSMGLQIGIISMAINPLLGLAANLYRSRREQSLLMLLPGMPRGAALNRSMGRRLLTQFYLQWSLALGLIAALMVVNPAFQSSRLGFYALLAILPMGAMLLRDWSRQPMPRAAQVALPFLGAVVGGLLLAGLSWLGFGLWLGAGLSVALSLALLHWRWRRFLLAAPAAMPVGRWA